MPFDYSLAHRRFYRKQYSAFVTVLGYAIQDYLDDDILSYYVTQDLQGILTDQDDTCSYSAKVLMNPAWGTYSKPDY